MRKNRNQSEALGKKQKKYDAGTIALVLLIICGLLFYWQGMIQKQELKEYDNLVTLIHSTGTPYFSRDAELMDARNQELDDSYSYVLWGTDGTKVLTSTEADRSNYPLDRMTVRTSDGVTLSSLEQNLENQLGFVGTALDYRFINSLIGLLGFGLLFLLWLWLLHVVIKEVKKYRLVCIGGVIALMVLFLCLYAKIPEYLIPTKWSDFEFWGRLRAEKAARMQVWIHCKKAAPELLYRSKSIRAVVSFAVSYICYLIIRILWFVKK